MVIKIKTTKTPEYVDYCPECGIAKECDWDYVVCLLMLLTGLTRCGIVKECDWDYVIPEIPNALFQKCKSYFDNYEFTTWDSLCWHQDVTGVTFPDCKGIVIHTLMLE